MGVIRLDIAYDGTAFRGYARQEGHRTVQGELESALATLLGATVATSVAGRTDAGVHAVGQVVSFRTDEAVDLDRLRRGLNGILGPEVAVTEVTPAAEDFDARFSATWRRYRYRLDTNHGPDPLERRFTWHVGRPLDLVAMRSVAEALIGEHDFTSFCRTVEGRSNVRRLSELDLVADDGVITVWARANAFCHQMVRSMVGHLYDVGRGFSDPATTPAVLVARDRSLVATVAPPHGLTLWAVGYDDNLA